MPELLFEIYSEEIPSEMQDFSANKLFNNMLEKLHTLFQKEFQGQYFFTPKRIGFYILDIPKIVDSTTSEIRGPKTTAPEKAIKGFLKKYNLKNTSNLLEKDGYYHYNTASEKKCTKEVIQIALEEIIATFVWPKSMRWGKYDIKWIRPIHSMLCLFDQKIILLNFGIPEKISVMILAIFAILSGGLTHYTIGTAPGYFSISGVNVQKWCKIGFLISTINILIWLTTCVIWWKLIGWY